MADNTADKMEEAETESESPGPRPHRPSTRKWVLPIAFLISILVHLVIGVGTSRLLNLPNDSQANTGNSHATIRLVQAVPMPNASDTKATPAKKEKPVAAATPVPVSIPEVNESRVPLPTPKPQKRVVDNITRPAVPVPPQITIPKKHPVVTLGNIRPNHAVKPLPRGSAAGNLPPQTVQTDTELVPRIAAMPDAQASPRPMTVPDTEAGKPAEGNAPATLKIDTMPKVAIGNSENSSSTESTGTGKAAGEGSGAGRTNGLGINRGIPFGDASGLLKGGDANGGGGGVGNGPGGGGFGGGAKRTPRFTLARAHSADDGPPVHIVYVLDVSGSMEEGDKIGKVRAAMEKALSELRVEDYFNIILFSDSAKLLSKTMRPATAANISAGVTTVDIANPNGSTNLSAALDLAFSQADVTHIFVMSDGEPTEGITDFDKIVEFARQRNNSNARIITLALGRGEKFKGMDLLRQLAEAGNGKFSYIDLSKPQ